MKLIFATTVFAMMAATVEAEVIHQQNFNSNMNGWTYKDNTHYDTNAGDYATGSRTNGMLKIECGGINSVDINDISGGFEHDFTLAKKGRIVVQVDWKLDVNIEYEPDEYGEAIVELDGIHVTIAKIAGGGQLSGEKTLVEFNDVEAGDHTVTVGAYNNKKTAGNEKTIVWYDNVQIIYAEDIVDNGTCQNLHLDFEGVERGSYIEHEWKYTHGVSLTCTAVKSGDDGRCRILDSSNPVGEWTNADAQRVGASSAGTWGSCQAGDIDLGSPNSECPGGGPGRSNDGSGGPNDKYPNCVAQGNILIVDERGPRCQPDDAVGGTITFEFDFPVEMDKVCYIDMDGAEETFIDLYYWNGGSTQGVNTVVAGDNGYACTNLNAFQNVKKMVFRMSGSGSVSDLYYHLCGDPSTTTTTTTLPTTTTTTTTTTTPTTTTTTPTTTTTTTTPATTTTTPATTTTTPATTTTTTTEGFDDGDKAGGGGGDPHIQRWGHSHSSFHGECDLVLVHSDLGGGLDLHVRSTIQEYFSYFEMAALRVGDNTIELHRDAIFVNRMKFGVADLPIALGDYTISDYPVEDKKNANYYQYYKVTLPGGSSMLFKYYKKYLTISIAGKRADFGDSSGLLGDYEFGEMLDRHGNVMTDFTALGFEWQVTPEDPRLFQELRSPQLPYEQCRMPTASRAARRKLRGPELAFAKEAQSACQRIGGSDFDLCVEDVVTTGDLGMAELW